MASILGKLLKRKKNAAKTPSLFITVYGQAASASAAREFERALELYDRAVAIDPLHAEAYYKRGNAFNELGRWELALADYDRAISIKSDYAHAYCNRGTVLEHLRRWDQALASYDRAIALSPGDFLAHYNRASALKELGRFDEALASYDRAIELKSDYAAAYFNRGHVQQKLRRYGAAIVSYDKAIELEPGRAATFLGRGVSLLRLRRFRDALASYEQAIALNEQFAEAHINRGIVLQEMGQSEAALASHNTAIELNPTFAEAFQARGFTLLCLRQFEAAVASYNRALALDPDRQYLLGMRLYAQLQVCDWSSLNDDIDLIVERIKCRNATCPPQAMLALVDAAPLHRLAAEIWVAHECPPDDSLGVIPARQTRQKIRIGYFSADFRNHAVALLTAELFEVHDRTKFEIIAFAFGPESKDAIRARLERAFDRFFDVRMHSDMEVASLARRLEIDIAVDLGGFTEHCRTGIFALRAAPIQISYIGYLGTMGAPYMDYLLADAAIIPLVEQANYAEKIVYLRSYQVNDSLRMTSRVFTREDLRLPLQGFIFSCFNSNYKIMPATFAMWMRILKRVENSSLYIYSENEVADRNLRNEALKEGVDPSRIIFGRRVGRDDYLARFRAMDLFLDTLPHNAGTTASDALWAGLPVLTCTGQSFAGRVATSLLIAIDLPELITSSPEHYENLAVQLAQDPERLALIRAKLERNRSSTPLFDTRSFAANLETAYTRMMDRFEAGLPPDHIRVDS